MSRIVIYMEVDEDFSDADHETGLTNQGYEVLMTKLSSLGYDIDVSLDDSGLRG